ncbi:MAG: fumarylacetoacetate hydrolase family protein [Solirubrobacteraceae bacterium]|nr:fumarylacetoacetate hydrolase family protein [Solirubrobacteraceae bacterium]
MKLVSFDGGRLGSVDGDEVVDLGQRAAAAGHPGATLEDLVRGELLDDARRWSLAGLPRRPIGAVRLEAPLCRPGKIVAAPVNYRAHQDEMEWPTSVEDLGVFLKAPSSIIGPGDEISLPYLDVRTDQEGELAVVIGRRARDVTLQAALDHVAGYTCLLDITTRSTEDRSMRKSFDTFTPLGPCLVTADEVADPDRLRLRCWVNGRLRQDASTAQMIFSVPLLIAYASSVLTLQAGDILATGTPAGVGPLSGGDEICVEIERVGRLEVGVSAERATAYAERPRVAG